MSVGPRGGAARGLRDGGGILGLVGLLAVYVAVPLPAPPGSWAYSTVVLDTHGRILRAFLSDQQQWYLPPDPQVPVPERLAAAVIHAEDRRFLSHPGFDAAAIARALAQYLGRGRVVSGASTITMQVARILDPKPRTLPSKLLELFEAIKLEAWRDKDGILRLYLDHAPYGGNVIGYRAASLRYFGKLPDALTWAECATLAVLPRSPGTISPTLDGEALRRTRDALLRVLAEDGLIDGVTLTTSLAEPLPTPRPFPRETPQLAQALRDTPSRAGGVIRTTVDLDLQHRVEAAVSAHMGYLGVLGIANAAVLVAETSSGEIRAWVGSQDFDDPSSGGQVDGVTARRSSGSILKPFLYALAMDAGILLPGTVLQDIPTSFGAFQPRNIGLTYTGLVTAHDALVRSLNIPAVRLLDRYGYRDFYQFLVDAGMSTLVRPPEDYGLTLILGGAETTLLDLVALYRGLGRMGVFEPLTATENEATRGTNGPVRLLSPGASSLTLDILRELKRPGLEAWWDRFTSSRDLAWKTGTSYGNRDAWAVGVNPRWTIGVWVGNFSGEPNPNLLSSASSAPLLFDVLAALPGDNAGWFATDPAWHRLEKICLDTGYIASPACPNPAWVPAPKDAPTLPVCPYHETIHVTLDGKWRVSSLCWTEGDHREATILSLPAEVTQYLREEGRIVPALPPWKPGCPVEGQGGEIRIIYPTEGIDLLVPRDMSGRLESVAARAAVRDEDERVYWYLDDLYLGVTTGRHVMTLPLTPGNHVLEVLDSRGNRARAVFRSTQAPEPERSASNAPADSQAPRG